MMWVECAWFKCRQRFKPGRRSNQSRRAGGAHHEGARYCSRSCQQKAYRLRRDTGSATVTPASEGTLPTQPSHALVSVLKTLLKFGRKMVILGRPVPSIAADRSARLSASYRTAFFIELLGPTLAFPTSAI